MSLELLVTIGASAGGITELRKIFREFPGTNTTAFFVVVHVSASSESLLPRILSSIGELPAEHPVDGQTIEPGRIYIAPPDHHLFIEEQGIMVSHGPRENRQRPAINPLFRSAARVFKSKVVGVLLSGMLDDGAAGLVEIKARGGIAIVQDPTEAAFPEMPKNALATAAVDVCAPIEEIRSLLLRLSANGGTKLLKTLAHNGNGKTSMTAKQKSRAKLVDTNRVISVKDMFKEVGPPSGFVCPECKGPLWENRNGNAFHYRCLVGHDFSPGSLGTAYGEELENALWIALRTLEERVELQRRLVNQAALGKQKAPRDVFQQRARQTTRHMNQLKKILEEVRM